MTTSTGLVRAAATFGNQDFRDSNMTETPTAARFTIVAATSDGVAANDAAMGIGATDGTNEWAYSSHDEDNQADTDAGSRAITSGCILIVDQTNAVDGEAAFVSFLADVGGGAGIRVNWTTAPGSAWLVMVELFAAENAEAGIFVTNGIENGTVTITPNFQSTLIFAHAINNEGGWPDTEANGYLVWGVCDLSLNQYYINRRSRDARPSGELEAITRNDAFIGVARTDPDFQWWGEVTSITSTTFVVTTRHNDNAKDVAFLALDMGSMGTWVGAVNAPTSTGDEPYTGPGFKPQMVGIGHNLVETINVRQSNDEACTFAVSAFTANNEYTQVVTGDDGAATTDTQSLSDNQAYVQTTAAGGLDVEATHVSMEATGWILNFSNVGSAVLLGFGWAIEEEAAAGQPVPIRTQGIPTSRRDRPGSWN